MASRKRILPILDLINLALARIFGQNYETSMIELNTGEHEIEFITSGQPARVWISLDTNDEEDCSCFLPVCHGNVDKAGFQIIEGGFILHADISSTSRKVTWFVSF